GVGGRRAGYRPVVSALCGSAAPADVAEAFRREYGVGELYLADLDAIGGGEPAWPVYEALTAAGFGLWVDAGVRTAEDGLALARGGVRAALVATALHRRALRREDVTGPG